MPALAVRRASTGPPASSDVGELMPSYLTHSKSGVLVIALCTCRGRTGVQLKDKWRNMVGSFARH